MTFYDVQVTTDLGEVAVLQICAFSAGEAEMTAISMKWRCRSGWHFCCLLFCVVAAVWWFAVRQPCAIGAQ